MKKLLFLFLLVSLVLTSCEKIDSSLIGNWELTESKYVITAGEDFTFVDVYGSSWQGTIKIADKEFDPSEFRYYFNNVWVQEQFSSQELRFTFAGPELEINHLGTRYFLKTGYVLNIGSGVFKADGTATYQDKSITVHVDLTMPKVELKKGDQFSVRDAYRYIPYNKLGFDSGGKLRTDFLVGDIVEILSGKWSVNNNQLNISVKNYSTNDTYQYEMNANSLLLSKDKTTKEMDPPHISPFSNKISKITYQALYMRE